MCQYPTLKYIYTNFWMDASITYLSRLTMIDHTWWQRLFGLFLMCKIEYWNLFKNFFRVETTTNLSNILEPLNCFISRFCWQLAINMGTKQLPISDILSYFLMFWPLVLNIQTKRLPKTDILSYFLIFWRLALNIGTKQLPMTDILSVRTSSV